MTTTTQTKKIPVVLTLNTGMIQTFSCLYEAEMFLGARFGHQIDIVRDEIGGSVGSIPDLQNPGKRMAVAIIIAEVA